VRVIIGCVGVYACLKPVQLIKAEVSAIVFTPTNLRTDHSSTTPGKGFLTHVPLRFSHQAIYTRMPSVHFHIVAFKVGDGSTYRQLSDFKDQDISGNFENYLVNTLKATKATGDDWYKLPDVKDIIKQGIQKTKDLGGNCYDLPYANSVRDLPSLRSLLGTY
jgi:hypothetical protein